jgi:hypothetical protein
MMNNLNATSALFPFNVAFRRSNIDSTTNFIAGNSQPNVLSRISGDRDKTDVPVNSQLNVLNYRDGDVDLLGSNSQLHAFNRFYENQVVHVSSSSASNSQQNYSNQNRNDLDDHDDEGNRNDLDDHDDEGESNVKKKGSKRKSCDSDEENEIIYDRPDTMRETQDYNTAAPVENDIKSESVSVAKTPNSFVSIGLLNGNSSSNCVSAIRKLVHDGYITVEDKTILFSEMIDCRLEGLKSALEVAYDVLSGNGDEWEEDFAFQCKSILKRLRDP